MDCIECTVWITQLFSADALSDTASVRVGFSQHQAELQFKMRYYSLHKGSESLYKWSKMRHTHIQTLPSFCKSAQNSFRYLLLAWDNQLKD